MERNLIREMTPDVHDEMELGVRVAYGLYIESAPWDETRTVALEQIGRRARGNAETF